MTNRWCAGVLATVMAGALAWGQAFDSRGSGAQVPSPQQSIQLTLPEALQRVLQVHPDIASAQAAITRAVAEAKIQRARRWPLIRLEGGVAQSKTRSALGTTQRTNHDAAATLDFTLYESGLAEQIARAETLAHAQKLGLPDAQRLLTFAVKSTYYQVLALRQVLRALMQSVAAAVRHQEAVEARIEAGTAPRSDLLPVLVEVADARLQATQGETNLKVAEAGLRSLLQLPAGTTLELAPVEPDTAPPGDLHELVVRARANRPDVRQQELNVRAAALGTRVARIDAGPVLSATATGEVGEHTDVSGDQWTLALGVSYPLFDAGASRAAVVSARATEEMERQRLEALLLQVQEEVEAAHVQVAQAMAAVENAVIARRDAENSLAAAEARYAEGLAIIIEVTDAQVALLRAQVNEIQARFEAASALAALDQAVGGL